MRVFSESMNASRRRSSEEQFWEFASLSEKLSNGSNILFFNGFFLFWVLRVILVNRPKSCMRFFMFAFSN